MHIRSTFLTVITARSLLTPDNLEGTDPAGYTGLPVPQNQWVGDLIIIFGHDGTQDSINQVGYGMVRRDLNTRSP